MESQEQQLRHLLDLCRRAERTGLRMTSGFCSPAEQEDFCRSPEAGKFAYRFEGGYPGAERQILVTGEGEDQRFPVVPEAGRPNQEEDEESHLRQTVFSEKKLQGAAWREEESPLPIVVLSIAPLSEKYAEELSHRDYLGAILGLGIERSLIGDILVREKRAWVFCLESIAEFLCQSLTQVRRTSVRVSPASLDSPDLAPRREPMSLNVASERLDAVVAAFAGISRAQASNLFAAGKVFVNSRPAQDRSAVLREGDILSVRGVGKAVYRGIGRETRKGRLVVEMEKYV